MRHEWGTEGGVGMGWRCLFLAGGERWWVGGEGITKPQRERRGKLTDLIFWGTKV